jgi:prophage antirepressor-like protein
VNNEPVFCLADVCKALDIKNVSGCKSRLNQKGVVITDTLTNGGVQQMERGYLNKIKNVIEK